MKRKAAERLPPIEATISREAFVAMPAVAPHWLASFETQACDQALYRLIVEDAIPKWAHVETETEMRGPFGYVSTGPIHFLCFQQRSWQHLLNVLSRLSQRLAARLHVNLPPGDTWNGSYADRSQPIYVYRYPEKGYIITNCRFHRCPAAIFAEMQRRRNGNAIPATGFKPAGGVVLDAQTVLLPPPSSSEVYYNASEGEKLQHWRRHVLFDAPPEELFLVQADDYTIWDPLRQPPEHVGLDRDRRDTTVSMEYWSLKHEKGIADWLYSGDDLFQEIAIECNDAPSDESTLTQAWCHCFDDAMWNHFNALLVAFWHIGSFRALRRFNEEAMGLSRPLRADYTAAVAPQPSCGPDFLYFFRGFHGCWYVADKYGAPDLSAEHDKQVQLFKLRRMFNAPVDSADSADDDDADDDADLGSGSEFYGLSPLI
jgi:hypothetical protein